MNEISIYIDREDRAKAAEEERQRFIKGVIEAIGIPDLETVWPDDKFLDVKTKIYLREFLKPFGIDIVEDIDNSTKIYAENDVIAEWFTPTYTMRTDPKARRRSQMFFLEMKIRFWSMWDNEEESDE
jgi:hypothetical protein